MELIGIFLDKQKNKPLYEQLYNALVNRIKTKQINAGEKLPSKRKAASELGVSVNTINEAYQMLVAEGYIKTKAKSGFVVNKIEQMPLQKKEEQNAQKTISKNRQEEKTKIHWEYDFASNGHDLANFPYKTWNRLSREVIIEKKDLFETGQPMGDNTLRIEIAKYLQAYRGVNCTSEQIIVGAGLEVLLSFLAGIVQQKKVAVEDPGYAKAAHILKNNKMEIDYIAVDKEGINIEQLQKSDAKIAYITPSHQFPTGGVMPITRRTKLLAWAQQENHLLIEDDYDSEYRFDGRPLPCMQGLDSSGKVVYLGTFSTAV